MRRSLNFNCHLVYPLGPFGQVTLVSADAEFLYAYCRKGKRRVGGTRPGYSWAVPRVAVPGCSFKSIVSALNSLGLPGFLIPTMRSAAGYWGLKRKCWDSKPMGYYQMVRTLRMVLRASGMPVAEARKRTYNSMRRFLPTLAGILQAPDSIKQAIGSWEEVPQGAHGGPRRPARQSMGLRYSGEQALQSGMAKREVLEAFLQVSLQLPGVRDIVEGRASRLSAGSFSWDTFARLADVQSRAGDVDSLRQVQRSFSILEYIQEAASAEGVLGPRAEDNLSGARQADCHLDTAMAGVVAACVPAPAPLPSAHGRRGKKRRAPGRGAAARGHQSETVLSVTQQVSGAPGPSSGLTVPGPEKALGGGLDRGAVLSEAVSLPDHAPCYPLSSHQGEVQVQWFQTARGRRVHLTHSHPGVWASLPLCQGAPFQSPDATRGEGLEQAGQSGNLCSTC